MGQLKNLQLGIESVIWNMEYLFGEKYASLQCIYLGFFSWIWPFLVCLLFFFLLGWFFCLFCPRPLCSMLSPSLGCAQNVDRSLKPTKKIEWSHSQDSSPVLEFTPKAQKLTEAGKVTTKKFNHIWCAITNAVNCKAMPDCCQLTNEDQLMIPDFWHEQRKQDPKFKQSQCAAHFYDKFPNLKQSTISKLLN